MSKVAVGEATSSAPPAPGFMDSLAAGMPPADSGMQDHGGAEYHQGGDQDVTPAAPQPPDGLSTDQRILQMKRESSSGYAVQQEQKAAQKTDIYKNESGRMTYYYENISQFELSWSHPDKVIPATPIGGVIDFADYFDAEIDIVNFKAIRKNEFPQNHAPFVRRLTPGQYLQKLENKRQLDAQKAQYHQSIKGKDTKQPQDKVSQHVEFKVNEYLNWYNSPQEQKITSHYSKYDFIQWVGTWRFTEGEMRWMTYVIKDPEILRSLMIRKQEIAALPQ